MSSTLPTEYWKVSSLDGTVITTATFWSNLWKTCVTDSTGVSNCKDFPSMLALNGQPLLPRLMTVVPLPQIDVDLLGFFFGFLVYLIIHSWFLWLEGSD